MANKLSTHQNFLQGINRRFSREQSVNPEFFYSLQNARIFSRGDTGTVQRIKGFTKFNQNATDYSKTLAMESFKEFFIVFYEDVGVADRFHVDVIGTDGAVEFTDFYDGDSTTEGSLVISDENLFISPHNKVLYYNNGSWVLTDYISQIGDITDVTLVDNSVQAEGVFSVTSGAVSAYDGEKAQASIRVTKNNTPSGQTDTFQVSVGANTTGDIVVSYTDTLHDIKDKIYNALVAVTAITDDWDIKKSLNVTFGGEGSIGRLQDFTFQSHATISLTSKTVGSSWNDVAITIDNSSYGIVTRSDGKREFNPTTRSDLVNTTFYIQQPQGGADARNNIGPLYIYFYKYDLTVQTANIVNGDTYAQIGQKIHDALTANDFVTNRFTISAPVDTGTQFDITITARRGGELFNTRVYVSVRPKDDVQDMAYGTYFSGVFEDIDGGSNSSGTGTLKNFEHYWYRIRYRFKDGHVTASSFPAYMYSDVGESITLTIDTTLLDIDGGKAQVEIFRKQGEGDFFLIERISPAAGDDTTVFTDDGKPNRSSVEEKTNIWTKSHNAQSIIDNRYVRGGVKYFDEVYAGEDNLSVVTTDTTDLNELPENSEARIYVRPQYDDGTFGYHSLVDTLTFNASGKKLRISQSAPLITAEKTIKRLGIYAGFRPRNVTDSFRFNSIEIANPNIPTIADQDLYPTRTRILFGFKYLELKGETDGIIRFRVKGWSGQVDEVKEYTIVADSISGPAELSGGHPRKLTIPIFGVPFTYRRLYVEESDEIVDDDYNSIYVLDCFDALKEAVKTKQLKLRLAIPEFNDGQIDPLISNDAITQIAKDSDKDVFSQEITVTNLIDESAQYPDLDFEQSNTFFGPLDSRIYLELEDSIFDDIENANVTDYSILNTTGLSVRASNITIPFELIGFTLDKASIMSESPIDYLVDGGAERYKDENTYYFYQWSSSVYNLINTLDLLNEDRLIYLTSKPNEVSAVSDIELTGFRNVENDALNFVYNNPFNIYDVLVEKTDINVDRTDFLNQIIWSGRILASTRYSQERNISPENFFPIPAKNGRILAMEVLSGRLYVFCQTGVLMCFIGETLARQKSGQVVVTDSNFITAYQWLMEELDDVKRETIVKKDNSIFFSDGYDVYQLSRDGGNITEGVIPLDPTHDYTATVDDQNDEYRISDLTDGVTWAYNYKFKQWYGPYTFVTKHGQNYKDIVVSVVGQDLVAHNNGNDFNGTAFDTIIESVANDTQMSFFDKNFRKFYLSVDEDANAVFRYGKDPASLVSVNMSAMTAKNGYKHQGIAPSEQNDKVIYWELQSADPGFALNDISWIFKQKARR